MSALADNTPERPRALDHKQLLSIANGNRNAAGSGRRLELVAAADIRSERIQWLWEQRIPLRGLTILCGEKGRGKSVLTNALLPAMATRGKLPGELYEILSDVLVCNAEDDWRSIVKPRLAAADADRVRVHKPRFTDKHGETLMTLPDDVHLLEEEIEQLRRAGRNVRLLVIDPIGAFVSSDTDSHRDASVRRALAPVAQMAERLDLAVLVVAHLTKDESARMINRVNGAGAFVNAARSVLALASDPDDPDGDDGDQRVLVHVRGNCGRPAPTLAAQVGGTETTLDDGTAMTTSFLRITGESDITVEDLQGRRGETSRDEVEEAILAALADGEKPSREVKAQVKRETSCGDRTIKRAASRLKSQGDLVQENVRSCPRTTISASLASERTRRIVPDRYRSCKKPPPAAKRPYQETGPVSALQKGGPKTFVAGSRAARGAHRTDAVRRGIGSPAIFRRHARSAGQTVAMALDPRPWGGWGVRRESGRPRSSSQRGSLTRADIFLVWRLFRLTNWTRRPWS